MAAEFRTRFTPCDAAGLGVVARERSAAEMLADPGEMPTILGSGMAGEPHPRPSHYSLAVALLALGTPLVGGG